MNIKKICDRFLEHCRVERGLSPHSLRAYKSDLQEFGAFLHQMEEPRMQFDQCRAEEIQIFLKYLKDSRGFQQASIREANQFYSEVLQPAAADR